MLMHLRRRASTDARARLVLIALAIPAVLIGLLAMHVLSGGASQAGTATHHTVIADATSTSTTTSTTTSTSHHDVTATTASHQPAAFGGCDPACEQDPEMAAMACLLALLVATLTLLASAQVHRSAWTPQSIWFLGLFNSAPPDPRPPSLIALSISRT